MTLNSMTDFVLDLGNRRAEEGFEGITKNLSLIYRYAEFLKQPLKLEMFVPCDDEGNILKKPLSREYYKEIGGELTGFNEAANLLYEQAEKKVLFKNSIIVEADRYKDIERFFISLNHQAPFRIYNKFIYRNGEIEKTFLPNFSEIPSVEYLVPYNLELTDYALKHIVKYE